jgi:cleavage and polyadenylation specificity factor subunit 2
MVMKTPLVPSPYDSSKDVVFFVFHCINLFRRHLEFFPNPQALLQTYSSKDPKLILAVPASLSHGPSRHLFQDFAAVPDNVVLLTSRGEERTLARALFVKWDDSQHLRTNGTKAKSGGT